MIYRLRIGKPFETGAIVETAEFKETKDLSSFDIRYAPGVLEFDMQSKDQVFGLGQTLRGINKRGWIYESYNSDEPHHEECKRSLYGSHNFIIVNRVESGKRFGLYLDYPGRVTFDIGYTNKNLLKISYEENDIDIYVIDGESLTDIVSQFRKAIGQSYIPPLWAFGYGQSRWGYKNEADIREVAEKHRKNHIPLDMIYMDIDYMDEYKDFTVSSERFPDLKRLAADMKAEGIHLITIIDAGVKQADDYDVYNEGVEKGYFVKDESGNVFTAAVWPGRSVFPDFLNPEARKWFGAHYDRLLDQGIDGFWNDMNEPAIFYTPKKLESAITEVNELSKSNVGINEFFRMSDVMGGLSNNPEYYKQMQHSPEEGVSISNDKVHNLFGMNMTRAAADHFKEIGRDKEILIFSRSSFIGAHRYSGIWQGDNISWWSHLKLNVAMTANLNMCGFLYTGADLGGFGGDTTEELLLRWLAFGIFTPLMRNHSALGTREQEAYRFEDIPAFRFIIGLRYRLLKYIYESFKDAAINSKMLFRPLIFDYEGDERVWDIDDQLLFGDALMIAPVIEQNALGRYVYLPEDMNMVRFYSKSGDSEEADKEYDDLGIEVTPLSKGDHYIKVPVNEVVVFLKKGAQLPITKGGESVEQTDLEDLIYIS